MKRNCLFNLFFIFISACSTKPVVQNKIPDQIQQASTSNILIPKEIYQNTKNSIFEVVAPLPEDNFIKYEKPLPVDKLPYRQRNEKFASMGTAFAIGLNKFVSAAHVFNLQIKNQWGYYALRDQEGNIFKIKNITKYSTYRDIVEFDIENWSEKIKPLALNVQSEIADTVYVVGNAFGEGISFRLGQLSVYSPEEVDNQWKFIRFSAPASPGNSGGPLLNEKGEVIGIVVRKNSTENLNYAVPIAELNNLKTSSAEFIFKNIRISRDEIKENKNYEFTLPLPEELSVVSGQAYKKVTSFFNENFMRLYDSKDERFFPGHPNFKEFLRHQPIKKGVGYISSDSKKTNWSVTYPIVIETDLGDDEQAKTYKSNWPIIFLDRPKNQSIAEFYSNPKLIMEKILKTIKLSRNYANEKILITSLGNPMHQDFWTDEYGRKWSTFAWETPSLNMFVNIYCTPLPSGVLCYRNFNPLAFSNLDALVKKILRQLLFSYSGTVAEWNNYLKMDKKFRPEFLQNMSLEQVAQKLSMTVGEMKIKFNSNDFDSESFVLVESRYSAFGQSALDVNAIIVDPIKKNKKYFFITSVLEPLNTAIENTKKYWNNLNSRKGYFDGLVRNKNKYSYISSVFESKNPLAAIPTTYYVDCGDAEGTKLEKLSEYCKSVELSF